MNIQTKFNVGDKVLTIDPSTMKIREAEIERVRAIAEEGTVRVSYHAKGDSFFKDDYPEEKCFATKNELLTFISTNEPNTGE